jgi:SAM-dependent methyltransferase
VKQRSESRALRFLRFPTRRFRERRMSEFLELMRPAAGDRIVDVGGTALNWNLVGYPGPVVLANIVPREQVGAMPSNVEYVHADGTSLPFGDREFSIAFSNSVIEHLHTFDKQQAFAAEIRRVAGRLWVQTPARSFPIEPHYLAPIVHYLPKSWQRRLIRNFTLYGWIARPSQTTVDELVDECRLLNYDEMKTLFPDCEIRRERVLGLTKSYVALRTAAPPRS